MTLKTSTGIESYFESMERMTIAERLPRNPVQAPTKRTHPFGARLMMTRLVIFDMEARIPDKCCLYGMFAWVYLW